MEDQDQDLHSLLQLALHKSIEGREQLSSQIAQMSMERDHLLSDQERDTISQILDKLIHEFEVPIRKKLSDRLSRNPAAPRALVIALANDEIEVARPMLLRSSLLSDDELIRIIHHRSHQHQIAIARRRELSEAVSDELVSTHDKDVIKTLLENHSARISEATLSYLAEQAEHTDEFQEPLVHRRDLTAAIAQRLYWRVAANLRADILKTYDVHPTSLDDELEATVLDLAAEQSAKANGPQSLEATATQLARTMASEQKISAALLIQTLRQGEVPLFEALFEEWSGISMPRRAEVIYGQGGETLAIACLALGVSKQDFATLFLLTRSAGIEGRKTSPGDLSKATKVYDQANRDDAKHVLRGWQRASGFQTAVEEMEVGRARQG